MNDILAGKWKQIRGQIQEKWGELTNDDLDRVEGKYDQLVGMIQEKYGRSRLEVQREVDEWLSSF